jgi:hypothetical protein
MDEAIPLALGVLLGIPIWLCGPGIARILLSIFAVAVVGLLATVLSGEYAESWAYLLLDFGEAAIGLVFGFAVASRQKFWRKLRHTVAPQR